MRIAVPSGIPEVEARSENAPSVNSPGEMTRAAAASPRPDVVLITLDTVRADHLSAYGCSRDTSPNLEALADGATLYTDAVASSDLTLSCLWGERAR